MVEFEIEGDTYTMHRLLTDDELARIYDALEKLGTLARDARENPKTNSELWQQQHIYFQKVILESTGKCFGMTEEAVRNMMYVDMIRLFRELLKHSTDSDKARNLG